MKVAATTKANFAVFSIFMTLGFILYCLVPYTGSIGSIAGFVLAFVIAACAALARNSASRLLRLVATCYVEAIRNTPVLLQIFIVYFFIGTVLNLSREFAGVAALALFTGAYVSEIVRAGVQSIPKGQMAAAQAMGMTYGQTMRLIILPQAFRKMTPLLLQQSIILFQDTSLVYAIGAYDMLKGFEVAGKNFGRPIEAYLAAAVLYFVMCYALSWSVKRLHKKIAIIR